MNATIVHIITIIHIITITTSQHPPASESQIGGLFLTFARAFRSSHSYLFIFFPSLRQISNKHLNICVFIPLALLVSPSISLSGWSCRKEMRTQQTGEQWAIHDALQCNDDPALPSTPQPAPASTAAQECGPTSYPLPPLFPAAATTIATTATTSPVLPPSQPKPLSPK